MHMHSKEGQIQIIKQNWKWKKWSGDQQTKPRINKVQCLVMDWEQGHRQCCVLGERVKVNMNVSVSVGFK